MLAMKITVLTENTTNNPNLTAEHGLSLFIETDNKNILFDMGQTNAFAENAKKMNVDLSKVDVAVLSHGHYDHGGGIAEFLGLNDISKVYLSKNAFGEHFNGNEKYIGLDKSLQSNGRIVFTKDFCKIDEKLSLFSCNDKSLFSPINPFGLNVKVNDEIFLETFIHEQYLLVNENGKRILFSGCSHKGVLNIQKWFKPDIFIGGFHLSKLNPQTDDSKTLSDIATELLDYNTKYYTAHCTGFPQFEYLKSYMGENLQYLSTGDIIEI